MSAKSDVLWVRDFVAAPGRSLGDRALRWGCVAVTAVLVPALFHAVVLHGLAVFGVGPQALAQEADMLQAISDCPDVRRTLGGLRYAPTRWDVQEHLTRCRDLEPLRRALTARAR